MVGKAARDRLDVILAWGHVRAAACFSFAGQLPFREPVRDDRLDRAVGQQGEGFEALVHVHTHALLRVQHVPDARMIDLEGHARDHVARGGRDVGRAALPAAGPVVEGQPMVEQEDGRDGAQVVAALLGFLFMAPGAVMVAGVVTRRQNGHIAVAGPLVNLGLFIVGLPLGALLLGLTNAFEVVPSMDDYFVDGALNWPLMLINICTFWLYANLILGLFNMLPFGPLDGLKVRDWSEGAFYAVLLIFAVPVLAMFFGMWSPIALLQGPSAQRWSEPGGPIGFSASCP